MAKEALASFQCLVPAVQGKRAVFTVRPLLKDVELDECNIRCSARVEVALINLDNELFKPFGPGETPLDVPGINYTRKSGRKLDGSKIVRFEAFTGYRGNQNVCTVPLKGGCAFTMASGPLPEVFRRIEVGLVLVVAATAVNVELVGDCVGHEED